MLNFERDIKGGKEAKRKREIGIERDKGGREGERGRKGGDRTERYHTDHSPWNYYDITLSISTSRLVSTS